MSWSRGCTLHPARKLGQIDFDRKWRWCHLAQLHLDAAHAHRTGFQRAGNAILELAEPAEGVWREEAGALLWSAAGTTAAPLALNSTKSGIHTSDHARG